MSPLLPVALAAAVVLVAVSWALRSARRAAEPNLDEEQSTEFALPALPALDRATEAPEPESDASLRRAPLVPIAGTDGPGQTAEAGDVLISMIGVPEALAQVGANPRPSGSRLPLLRGDSASPFRGESVDLGAPQLDVEAELDGPMAQREPRVDPASAAAASVAPWAAGGILFGVAWIAGAPALVSLLLGVAVGSLTLAAARQIEVSRARASQPTFEAQLARSLDTLDGLLADGTPPERSLRLLVEAEEPGPLLEELRGALAAWWPEAERPDAFGAARDRRGAEWARVLFALDEAARTGTDPRRLLRHTAESLRDDEERGPQPSGLDPGAAIAIAGSVVAASAAIAIAVAGV